MVAGECIYSIIKRNRKGEMKKRENKQNTGGGRNWFLQQILVKVVVNIAAEASRMLSEVLYKHVLTKKYWN